jgi:uncharacterized lipoprotein YddW (UPF0748 family)
MLYNPPVRPLLAPILALVLSPALAWGQAEVRGTWYSTTGYTTGPFNTSANTNSNVASLRAIGLNTIYTDAFRNGATYFNSPSLQRVTGQLRATEIGTRDLVSEVVIAAHRNRMAAIPWFQYGLMAQFGDSATAPNALGSYMHTRGWLLKNQAGTYTDTVSGNSNNFSWMNPAVPEVRALVKNMALDLVTNYDVDGIQFDDHLAWPINYGFDSTTAAIYLAETGNALPTSATNTAFRNWRAGKITSLITEIQSAVKAVRPNAIVSVSPGIFNDSLARFCVDWPTWRANGLLDEYVPQVYRNTYANFEQTWDGTNSTTGGQVQYMGPRRADFAGGIAFTANGVTNTLADLQSSINLTRSSGVSGHVLWYANDVLSTPWAGPLTTFYGGAVDRPDQPSNWRRAPLVMTLGTDSLYRATTPELNRYRIIGLQSGVWREILSTVLPAGANAFGITGTYSQVEILVDRRGWMEGDATFDGRVDLDDAFALVANFGQSNRFWYQGDFTLDGRVDQLDIDYLAARWGNGVSGSIEAFPFSVVPEPGALLLAGAAGAMMLRRRPI